MIVKRVVANRWLLEPLLLWKLEKALATNAAIRTTTAITTINGDVKPNILPQIARALANFRILPGDTAASVIKHVRRVIDDNEIEVRRHAHRVYKPSPISDPRATSFATLHRTIEQVFPDTVVAPNLALGATDSRHYGRISDNVYRFMPMRLKRIDLKRIHGTDERITVSNYTEMVRFYLQLIRNSSR